MAAEEAAARKQRIERLVEEAVLADAAAASARASHGGVLSYRAGSVKKRAPVNRLFLASTVAAAQSANVRLSKGRGSKEAVPRDDLTAGAEQQTEVTE
jgi:hypothetical protein